MNRIADDNQNQRQSDDQMDEKEQLLARKLINHLFVLLRTAYIHRHDNEALIPPLQNIDRTTNEIFRMSGDNVIGLRVVSSTFFLNDTLVKLDQSSFENAEFLHIVSEELDVGEFEFHQGCNETDFRALMASVVNAVRGGQEAVANLQRSLGRIVLKKSVQMGTGKTVLDQRQFVLRTYALSLVFVSTMVKNWKTGRRPRMSEIKRMSQTLLDILDENAITLLGLTNLHAYKEHLANHWVNVTILAQIVGTAAGLNKSSLVRLGMMSLLHEVGMIDLPEQLINRIDTLSEVESAELARLPLLSVLRLLEFDGVGQETIDRVIAVWENYAHVPGNCAYYTQNRPDVLAQILAVCDAYDHLTTSRLGNIALLPDQALETLLVNSERKYAEWAVKLLAQCIGRYPIGTLVELNTGEKGIVVNRPASGVAADRPVLRMVAGGSQGAQVNLAHDTSRRIVCSLDPDHESVNVPHFFLD
jgi:HD-GYP domain-containing protein (c-di-GMP phosphodiesterase class II)